MTRNHQEARSACTRAIQLASSLAKEKVLAATQMPEEPAGWFQGTADAIRKFIWVLEDYYNQLEIEHILILCGDQIYRMNFMELVQDFLENTAYPLLEGCATFLVDWLIEGPAGCLETNPSTSPEHAFVAPGAGNIQVFEF